MKFDFRDLLEEARNKEATTRRSRTLLSGRPLQDPQITRLYKEALMTMIDKTFRDISAEKIFGQFSLSTDVKAT